MTLLQWLRSARGAVVRRLHRSTSATDNVVSGALRWVGLLSVLLFLLRNAFELFVAHGMYEAQRWLIAVLDGVLAVWALAEILWIGRTSMPIPVGPLAAALAAQLAVVCIRLLLIPMAPASLDRLDRPFAFGLATVFVPIHTVVFLIIGKLLIDAFSHAERLRANQLEAQVALTKKAEAELRVQQEEVVASHRRERASAARQRRMLKLKLESSLLASAVAHEIKIPLSTILLRTKLPADPGESNAETLAAVACDVEKAVRTIEKMNILLRSVETEHARIDLTQVVRTCLVESRVEFARLEVTVMESGLTRPCFIDGDEAQLRIAVANVLRNAVEALDAAAGGAATPTIVVSLRRGKRSAVLAIGDSGPGWSGAERGSAPLSTTKPSGSGLGLYVVRTVVRRNHRGKIAFRRSPLGGAELRLWFPRNSTQGVRHNP
ncbi:MAG: hypothetical protein RLZZ21_1442 [Planctomycetota bacterium]|jgi:signal transduction histidine kinase